MEELPAHLRAYPVFLTVAFHIYLEAGRDLALGSLFFLAGLGDLRVFAVGWNIYSAITFPFFVLAVFGAIDRFQAAFGN